MNAKCLLVLPLSLTLLLAACGGGGDDDDDSTGDATTVPGATATRASSDAGASADPANIDVCSMLTDEEAAEVASAEETRLGGPGATYTVTREKIEYTAEQQRNFPQSSCRFVIDAGGALAVVQVIVSSGDTYDLLYRSEGTPVAGVGDHAVFYRGSAIAKVGDLQLSIGEYTATAEFNMEIFRRIAPDLPQ